MARAHEIVVFGATGFTGGLVCEYLAKSAPDGTRWAIAGRDERKLHEVRSRVSQGARVPPADVIVADVGSPDRMKKMAESARVVLTTVGPYAEHGEPVVRAAVEGGAHYVDITGEPEFVDRCIDRYDGAAREQGLKIVNCCGFDSIPPDLGAMFTAQQLPRDEPMRIEGFLRSRGTFSGGTWHSAIGAFAKARNGMPRRKPPAESGPRRARLAGRRIKYVREIESWAVPLPTIDPQIVLRSARELDVYGPDFQYGHFARVRHLRTAMAGVAGVAALVGLAQVPATREMLLRVRKQGEGPSAEQRAKSWFELTFVGEAARARVVTTVSGGDPGYGETAKMVSEAALCLARDRDLPMKSGILTPAVAMGDRLRERLQKAGIRFHVKERT
jgi:short subunit dehydrogenase-like uncharacterized protein